MARTLRLVVWAAGGGALAIGIARWLGFVPALVGLHMALGGVLVLALWMLAVLAARRGVNRGAAVMAAVVGVIVPIVGAYQGLVPHAGGWDILRTAHLIVGVVAIAQGESLSHSILHPRAAKAPWWETAR